MILGVIRFMPSGTRAFFIPHEKEVRVLKVRIPVKVIALANEFRLPPERLAEGILERESERRIHTIIIEK